MTFDIQNDCSAILSAGVVMAFKEFFAVPDALNIASRRRTFNTNAQVHMHANIFTHTHTKHTYTHTHTHSTYTQICTHTNTHTEDLAHNYRHTAVRKSPRDLPARTWQVKAPYELPATRHRGFCSVY